MLQIGREWRAKLQSTSRSSTLLGCFPFRNVILMSNNSKVSQPISAFPLPSENDHFPKWSIFVPFTATWKNVFKHPRTHIKTCSSIHGYTQISNIYFLAVSASPPLEVRCLKIFWCNEHVCWKYRHCKLQKKNNTQFWKFTTRRSAISTVPYLFFIDCPPSHHPPVSYILTGKSFQKMRLLP